MEKAAKGGLLVACGFLLGTVGMKVLTSQSAKRCYVQGVAQGLRAKSAYESILEQAKAEVDDIVSEASYLVSTEDGRIDSVSEESTVVDSEGAEKAAG